MKKVTLTILIITYLTTNAQGPFELGINAPSIALINLSIIGELPVKDKLSLNLGLSLRPPLNFLPGGDSSLYDNLKGVSLSPELRYYLNGYSQTGLFIGPYLRFQRFSTGQVYHGLDYWSGITTDLYIGIYHTEFGLGLNAGFRYKISNFSVDLFVGPRFSFQKFEFRYYHLPNETKGKGEIDIEDFLNFSLPGIKKAQIENTTYYDKLTASGFSPNLRLGLTINYFFNIEMKAKNTNEIYYDPDKEY